VETRPNSDLVIKESNELGHRRDAALYLALAALYAPVEVIAYTPKKSGTGAACPRLSSQRPIPEQFHA
jgi:hypothetical protein